MQHLGLLAGLVALGRSGWPGQRRRGVQAASVGMGLLTAMPRFPALAAGFVPARLAIAGWMLLFALLGLLLADERQP